MRDAYDEVAYYGPTYYADELRERFAITERADLPEVTEDHDSRGTWYRAGNAFHGTAVHSNGVEDPLEHAERRAREFAAIAAHLREHPPVDEEQVRALADELAHDYNSRIGVPDKYGYHNAGSAAVMGADFQDKARRMVQRGVRVEVKEG